MDKKLDFYCDQILSGRVPVKKVFESDTCLAFHHTKPSWTLHIIIIPKTHIENLTTVQDFEIVKEMLRIATDIVRTKELSETNYKIITNGGTFQDTKHLHFHLVSGTPLNSVTREP